MDKENILEIIKGHTGKAGLISILEVIQEKYTYLPETALRIVAEETGHSLADIYGVATFYKAFSLKPRGKHSVCACLGTACHVRGAQKVVEEFEQQLNVIPGETTADDEITFETVNCLGACALGPIVVSDGRYFANVKTKEVEDIIEGTKDGTYGSNGGSSSQLFPVQACCPRCGRGLMDNEYQLDGYPSMLFDFSMEGKSGRLRMSSLYGSFATTRDQEVPEDALTTLSCPHCKADLQEGSYCLECGAPQASIRLAGGDGVIRICTRVGCKGHMLDLNGEVQ